jgi:hypothetical protein
VSTEVDVRVVLHRLASLIRKRNEIDLEMAELLGRPATAGNLGEFIAAAIFDIELAATGVNPGHDGVFRSGPLAGKTVNVKLYSEDAGLLDVGPYASDYYLVLTGPKPTAGPGPRSLPRRIDAVYLFDMEALRQGLTARRVGIGIATSVRRDLWQSAQIFPLNPAARFALTRHHVELLRLFAPEAGGSTDSGQPIPADGPPVESETSIER